jgi:YesN/AraC family two-component response regulator
VIILDIVMPDVDGIEVIQWLAEQRSQARIILMTGFDPRYAKIAEHVGTFKMKSEITTLLKPISVTDITAALRNEKFDPESAGAPTAPAAPALGERSSRGQR